MEFKQMNEVIFVGPIVRKFSNEVACNFTIKTARLNLPNVIEAGEIAYNYPEIAFYSSNKDEIAEKYKPGDVVQVRGMIQPHKKIDEATGKTYYDQKLIGLDIRPAEKVLKLEFGYDEGDYMDTLNRIKLGGQIAQISSPSKGMISFNIITFTNGHVNNIRAIMYVRNTKEYLEKFHVGDKVFAVGTLQTMKKDAKDGQERHYKNVVLKAICIAE